MTDTVRHYVEFLSPGSFVAERTIKEITSWDIDEAVTAARNIKERHGARPYGFRFFSKVPSDDPFEAAKIKERSGIYYLGGKVRTAEEVLAGKLKEEEILRSNVRCNGWAGIVTTNNSYKWSQPLKDKDVVLEIDF